MASSSPLIVALHGTGAGPKLERTVVCIHCRKQLGVSSSVIDTLELRFKHTCTEALLASQPATPPPFH